MYPWDNKIPTERYQWDVLAKVLLYGIGLVSSVSVWYRPATHTQDISIAFKRKLSRNSEKFEFTAPAAGPGREFFEQLNARIKLELSE